MFFLFFVFFTPQESLPAEGPRSAIILMWVKICMDDSAFSQLCIKCQSGVRELLVRVLLLFHLVMAARFSRCFVELWNSLSSSLVTLWWRHILVICVVLLKNTAYLLPEVPGRKRIKSSQGSSSGPALTTELSLCTRGYRKCWCLMFKHQQGASDAYFY